MGNIEIRLSNTLYGTDSNPMRRPITVVRPDVYSIKSTQVEKEIKPTVHEVKVSRPDFLSDIRTGKWEGYRTIADYVYFACPEGVAKKAEIPDGCGLLELRSEQWVVVKRAKRQPVTLSPRQWIKLLQVSSRKQSHEAV